MLIKITTEGQIALPEHVLKALGVGPGDRLELLPVGNGISLRPERNDNPNPNARQPKKIDHSKQGTLRHLIKPGTPPFDIRKFRDERSNPRLYRD